MSFVVIATWTARPGEAEHIAGVIARMIPGNRAEPKNLAFHAQRSAEDPDVFMLYEEYTDESGYEEHRASEPFQRLVVGDVIPRLESRRVWTGHPIEPAGPSAGTDAGTSAGPA